MRNRREEILMAALELAAEKGLGNVSLHMIAAAGRWRLYPDDKPEEYPDIL